jgi:hypothetical protein
MGDGVKWRTVQHVVVGSADHRPDKNESNASEKLRPYTMKNSHLAHALDIAFLVTMLRASPESGKIIGWRAAVPNIYY